MRIFLIAFLAVFCAAAHAQVPAVLRNEFTTNSNPNARMVVTNIVNSLVSTGGISTTTATNIATAVAQQYATNNFVYVNDFGALADNGTTDNYAAIIAAIATGKEVRFRNRGTNYYESSPFILTNTTLNLSGARLKMKGTSTNFFIQFAPVSHSTNSYAGTNGSWGMTKIIGGEIWGGGSNNVATFGNRHGVWVDPYGAGNALLDTYIHGFNGIGVQVASSRPFTASLPFLTTDLAPLNLSGVVVSNCYYGWNFVGGQPSGIPSAPSDIYLAEYVRANGIAAFGNMVGIRLEAGNSSFAGSSASRNTNNFLICSNQNNGHGTWVGGTINHAGAYSILASNVSNGYIFAGAQIFFGNVYLTNCDGVIITDGELDTSAVTFGGGGRNEVRFNTYPNTAPTFTYGGTAKAVAYANNKTTGTAVTALPWDLMSTNQHVIGTTNGIFSYSTNKGSVVLGGNYSPTAAENVFNGNSAFNIQAPWGNYGSFTFDAVGANRVGFTIRNGFYPWLTFGTNVPLYIGESALSDLQTLSANPTYANRAYMSFMGSKITNHQDTYFLGSVNGAGSANFTSGSATIGAGGAYRFNGRSAITSSSDGVIGLANNALSSFNFLSLGGQIGISNSSLGFEFRDATAQNPTNITAKNVKVSQPTPSSILALTAEGYLTNATMGSGVSFVGNTLTASGGGGGGLTAGPDGTTLAAFVGSNIWVDLGDGMYIDDSIQFGASIFGGRDFGTASANRGYNILTSGLVGANQWFSCMTSNGQYGALRYGATSPTIGAVAANLWSNRFFASTYTYIKEGGQNFTNAAIMFGATSGRFDIDEAVDGVRWYARPGGNAAATWYAGVGIGSTWTYVTSTIPVTNYLVKLSMLGDYQGVAFFTNDVWFCGISNNIPTNRIYAFGIRQTVNNTGTPTTTNQVQSFWRNVKALIQ